VKTHLQLIIIIIIILVKQLFGKWILRRPKIRKKSIKLDLRQKNCEDRDRVKLVQNDAQWRTFVLDVGPYDFTA
jgi:hypothetical protein